MPKVIPLPALVHKPQLSIQAPSLCIPPKIPQLDFVQIRMLEAPAQRPLDSFTAIAFPLVFAEDVQTDHGVAVVSDVALVSKSVLYSHDFVLWFSENAELHTQVPPMVPSSR